MDEGETKMRTTIKHALYGEDLKDIKDFIKTMEEDKTLKEGESISSGNIHVECEFMNKEERHYCVRVDVTNITIKGKRSFKKKTR